MEKRVASVRCYEFSNFVNINSVDECRRFCCLRHEHQAAEMKSNTSFLTEAKRKYNNEYILKRKCHGEKFRVSDERAENFEMNFSFAKTFF